MGLLLVSKFTNLKIKDLNFAILSIIYSYASYVCIGSFYPDFLTKPVMMSAASIIVCLVASIFLIIIFKSKHVQDGLIKLFNTNLNTTIWDEVIDYKNGTNIKVYLKGRDYYILGSYKYHEDGVVDPFFAITCYSKVDRTTGKIDAYLDHNGEYDRYFVFRLSDVEYMETF